MIRVDDLRYRYPGHDKEALRGVSFEIPRGALTLVSGPTGSAKTTLALCLCGALPKLLGGRLMGRITIGGTEIATRPVREIVRNAGLLMQNVEWQIVTDRVADEVAFSLENFAVPENAMEQQIVDALQLAGARHLRDRRLSTLSAGERQRVVLASLLVLGQEVLILDEPLAYLDRAAGTSLIGQLLRLAESGKTVVVFEHRRDLIRPAAEFELRLDDGQLVPPQTTPADLPALAPPGKLGPDRLAFEGAHFRYFATPLLEHVSFEVRGGECVVLAGGNGSGKTTLMRSALGLVRPGSGVVRTCGFDVGAVPVRKLVESAALVLQNPDHQLHLPTVREEISAGAADPGAVETELDALGLADLAQRHPHSLSTGQKRRVTIAAALARNPDLLLLDEPTVGQDDANLGRIVQRLDRYVQEGGSLLAATHDQRAARAMGHRVVLLANGTAKPGGTQLFDEYFNDQRANTLEAASIAPASDRRNQLAEREP